MKYSASTNGFYDVSIHGKNIPPDSVDIAPKLHATLLLAQQEGKVIQPDANGEPVAVTPIPTAEQIVTGFTSAIQKKLDDFAKTRGYDGILSASTYATSLIPKFKAEGQYAVEARDNTWASAYSILTDVQTGKRPMPTEAQVLSKLPTLAWPV